MGLGPSTGGASKQKFSTERLLVYLRLCPFLKGGASRLKRVVEACLRVELPLSMQSLVLDASGALKRHFPSPSLLHRYEFILDLALMYIEAQRTQRLLALPPQRLPVRFGHNDSTPMLGYDWIWSQFVEVEQDDLIGLFEAVEDLTNSINQFVANAKQAAADRGDDDEVLLGRSGRLVEVAGIHPLDAWVPCLKIIRDKIREHINPPAALGSGHRNLHDKCASEVHKIYVQKPPILSTTMPLMPLGNQIGKLLLMYLANCSDMGCELSIPDFEHEGAGAFLPEWVNQNPHEPDIEMEELDSPREHPHPRSDEEGKGTPKAIASDNEDVDGPATRIDLAIASDSGDVDGPQTRIDLTSNNRGVTESDVDEEMLLGGRPVDAHGASGNSGCDEACHRSCKANSTPVFVGEILRCLSHLNCKRFASPADPFCMFGVMLDRSASIVAFPKSTKTLPEFKPTGSQQDQDRVNRMPKDLPKEPMTSSTRTQQHQQQQSYTQ